MAYLSYGRKKHGCSTPRFGSFRTVQHTGELSVEIDTAHPRAYPE
jgi:hypothetical protein